jgi:hypothetical protein
MPKLAEIAKTCQNIKIVSAFWHNFGITDRIPKNTYKGYMQVCLTILVKFQKVIKFYLHRF